ncbi:MAG: endo-1,4-beta-xylanase [Rhodoferax sp.]|nr:endo-1,4-beta-xylanase [Rhodoferax sp.]
MIDQTVSVTNHMNRREWLGATALSCMSWQGLADAQAPTSLDALARASGRRFGFAVSPAYADKAPVAGLLRQHAGVITAENAMKWRHIQTVFGGRDYTDADKVMALAASLKADFRGHTLAWHQSTPAYLSVVSSEQFIRAQTAHLQALVSRYQGRIHTWDVLNEAIEVNQSMGSSLRDSVLSKLWGVERYPALFELARAADPQAKLAYSDYGMEQDEPWCERRRRAVLLLLEPWVKRMVPVDVMGLQAHLDLSHRFSATKLLAFFDELQAFGLTIQITELDVRDSTSTGSLAERDSAVAALYQDFVDACLSHPAVEMMVLWNVTDADTWINRWGQGPRRADGQPMRPTLFDEQGQPKRAFEAVAASLRHTKVRFDKKAENNV